VSFDFFVVLEMVGEGEDFMAGRAGFHGRGESSDRDMLVRRVSGRTAVRASGGWRPV